MNLTKKLQAMLHKNPDESGPNADMNRDIVQQKNTSMYGMSNQEMNELRLDLAIID